ncbi:ABC transporter substrate-binding protein [Bradyrhizobium sp. HKCCYLS20291]|uniref:ABC transporter substrate-binding protein n=1 Tax=Bradyrhizobium sp. HKCCYLS20291 TaxID=3420766 RepID=UPI003EB7D72B
MNRIGISAIVVAAGAWLCGPALAQKYSGPGVTESEIKIGSLAPYSGPASAYGTIGKAYASYFKKINDEGGINGRKINFISYDDAYSPPKSVEQTRKLVESDEVLLVFGSVGTPTNAATQRYLNSHKVPQLFVASGASRWDDPSNFPWTMGWFPTYQSEGRIFGKYILSKYPNSKIAAIWQNDDAGKDIMKGFKEALGSKSSMIVVEKTYESTDPTVDSQVVALRDSGADILASFTTPKPAAQTIRKTAELGWKPIFLLTNVSASIPSVLRPAGLENSKGIISTVFLKDPNDPSWVDDPAVIGWRSFMDQYYPQGDKGDINNVLAVVQAEALIHVLKQCGEDLSRENVMKQAASLKDYRSDLLLPGIHANTSPTDFLPLDQLQIMQFDGRTWQRLGETIDAALH